MSDQLSAVVYGLACYSALSKLDTVLHASLRICSSSFVYRKCRVICKILSTTNGLEAKETVAELLSYTRAFGNGPRNFEPWSSDVDDTLAGTPSPNYHTTTT
ncbi:hypothetical protein TNCV_2504371 [Trichonephila clavipes]|uniref:Uncharacterized protein n=1 Tax=Trichonephila clavipes TaxID=2585209 RepID=A0A8X6WFV7_TRICX|nr:hypothetical protein TNCV_2504371 [Trichonephila clavipes]